jgi:hypothetical protein
MPRFKGDRCVIHIAPFGTVTVFDDQRSVVMDARAQAELLRHEMAHCHGVTHPVGSDGTVNHSKWVAPPLPKIAKSRPAPSVIWWRTRSTALSFR